MSKTGGPVPSAAKSSSSWDEDWGPVTKGSANSHQPSVSNTSSTKTVSGNQPIQFAPAQLQRSMIPDVSSQQTVESVDVEWPPRTSSSSVTNSQSPDIEKQQPIAGVSSSPSFDDIDPFADWPPRRSGTSSGLGTPSNGKIGLPTNSFSSSLTTNTSNNMSFQTNGNNSWATNNNSSTLNTAGLSSGGVNNLNSIAYLKQSQTHNTDKKSVDLGSIFGSSRTEQTAPRLAPPPSTAVGRGRGRGRGATNSTSRPSHVKPSSEQPPLLDLL